MNRQQLIRQALHYTIVLLLAHGMGAFNLGQGPNCFAQQKVRVSPGANLQALVTQYGANTAFSLSPGTYRLQSIVPQNGDSFVGVTGALLSGAALLTNWTEEKGPIWVTTASVTAPPAQGYPGVGNCLASSPLCPYPQDLFFNSALKMPVASLSAVKPGTWYLDSTTGRVYTGDNPLGKTVELSELSHAFSGGARDVTISNLIVEKYAAVAQAGAIDGSGGSASWTVEGNTVRYNHGTGIRTGDFMSISSNKVYNNGQLGIGGSGTSIIIQSNTIYANNTSGYSYYWEAGGVKLAYAPEVTYQYNYAYNNQGPGFWTDLNTSSVKVNQNQSTNNVEAGFMIELSNSVTVSDNDVWNDGFNPSGTGIWWGAGIFISDSSYVSIYGNTVSRCMNGIAGILRNAGDGPNNQPYSLTNVSATGNAVTQATGVAAGIAIEGTGFTNDVYTSWSNSMSNNTWHLSRSNYDYFYWLNEPMTLAQFSAAVDSE